jgi:hypothetical protein
VNEICPSRSPQFGAPHGPLGGPGRELQAFHQKTFVMEFRPAIGLDKTLTLAAELEAEEIARKLGLRK